MLMRNRSRHIYIAWLLLALLLAPAGEARSHRFSVDKKARPLTTTLPAIDKVELLKLEKKGDLWTGNIEASKTIEGVEAGKIASLWRTLQYGPFSAACHLPAYGIKFYRQGEMVVYATVCWECDNIEFITPKLGHYQGFNGKQRQGQALLKIFRQAFSASPAGAMN